MPSVPTGPQGFLLWGYIFLGILLFALLLVILHLLPTGFRRYLIIGMTFLAGLYYLLEFVIPPGFPKGWIPPDKVKTHNILTLYLEPISDWTNIIYTMALGMAIFNLCRVNGRALFRRSTGWQNSLIFFVGLIGMAVVGIWEFHRPDHPIIHQLYLFLFDGLYSSLGATVFGLLAFFIVTAAYRAFRIRSAEATLMMVTAFIVMLGNVPIGTEYATGWIPEGQFYSFLKVEHLMDWIMNTINMSAQRALLFGIAVGWLATSLRIWLNLERGRFFGEF